MNQTKPIKPYNTGDKVSCKKDVWTYPHDLRSCIVVDKAEFIPLSVRLPRDVERRYFGHWRIYGHLENRTEFTINGPDHVFYAV
jgi:hypothetical protein